MIASNRPFALNLTGVLPVFVPEAVWLAIASFEAGVLQVTLAFASFDWLFAHNNQPKFLNQERTQQSTNYLHQGYFLNIRVTLFLASPFVFVFEARHFFAISHFP